MTSPKKYIIKDVGGETWGWFVVQRETRDIFGNKNIHGYLNPTPYFEDIHHVFIEYEQNSKNKEEPDPDEWRNIIQYKPFLIDAATSEVLSIKNTIFVDKNYLVTCSIEKE